MQIFLREEIDFWINCLRRSPLPIFEAIATAKSSGELITVNELRKQFQYFPDHPNAAVGNLLINGDPKPVSDNAVMVALATYTKQIMQANNSNASDDYLRQQLPELMALLDPPAP